MAAQLKRPLLLSLAILLASLGLYLGVLVLDLYWNVLNWRPRLDGISTLLLAWIASLLAGLWRLARAPHSAMSRTVLRIAGLLLLSVSLLALPPEPLGEGLLGRQASSPAWYRMGRVVLLALPLTWAVIRHPQGNPADRIPESPTR